MGVLRGIHGLVVGGALMAAGIGSVLLGVLSGDFSAFAFFGLVGLVVGALGFFFFKLGWDLASDGESLGLPRTHTVQPTPEERIRQNRANVKIVVILSAIAAAVIILAVLLEPS